MGWGGAGVIRGHQVQFFKKCVFDLSCTEKAFIHQGRSNSGQGHPRSSGAIFQKVCFWPPMHRKSILNIKGDQNQHGRTSASLKLALRSKMLTNEQLVKGSLKMWLLSNNLTILRDSIFVMQCATAPTTVPLFRYCIAWMLVEEDPNKTNMAISCWKSALVDFNKRGAF